MKGRSKAAEDAITWRDRAPACSEERKLFDDAAQLYFDAIAAKPPGVNSSSSPLQLAYYNRARRLVLKARALRDSREALASLPAPIAAEA